MPERRRAARKSHARKVFTIGFRVRCFYLAKSVQASISMTRGAGGFAVSGSLSVRGVIFDDSPAFALFNLRAWDQKLSPTTLLARMEGTVRKLDDIFRRGEAAPTDVDQHGNTLFQVSTRASLGQSSELTGSLEQYALYWTYVNPELSSKSWDLEFQDRYLEFYSALERFGIPLNEVPETK